MPRGRSKTQAFAQRTDLQGKVPNQTPKGLAYGEAKASADAQRIVPVGNPAVPPAVPVEPAPAMRTPVPTPVPLSEATQRPNEDILTGMNTTRQANPDLAKLKSLQPIFEAEALSSDAPEIFREFTKWLRSQ